MGPPYRLSNLFISYIAKRLESNDHKIMKLYGNFVILQVMPLCPVIDRWFIQSPNMYFFESALFQRWTKPLMILYNKWGMIRNCVLPFFLPTCNCFTSIVPLLHVQNGWNVITYIFYLKQDKLQTQILRGTTEVNRAIWGIFLKKNIITIHVSNIFTQKTV